MSPWTQLDAQSLRTLAQICSLITTATPLAEVLEAVVRALQECAGAQLGLCVVLPAGRPAEFYGPQQARKVGEQVLLQVRPHLQERGPAVAVSLSLHLTSDNHILYGVAASFPSRQRLNGCLVGLYQAPPPEETLGLITLLAGQAGVAVEKSRLEEIVSQSYSGTIQALASAIDARDPSTHRHSRAVTELAVALAQALGLGDEEVETVRYAAILHDIGKIGISEAILSKRTLLTPEERAVVEAHPVVGVSILRDVPAADRLIPLILYHHERYDGSGYPMGLRGEEIPRGARILAIADSFDAMTTERPYHRGISILEACATLEAEAGILFDPKMVRVFVQLLRERMGLIKVE